MKLEDLQESQVLTKKEWYSLHKQIKATHSIRQLPVDWDDYTNEREEVEKELHEKYGMPKKDSLFTDSFVICSIKRKYIRKGYYYNEVKDQPWITFFVEKFNKSL